MMTDKDFNLIIAIIVFGFILPFMWLLGIGVLINKYGDIFGLFMIPALLLNMLLASYLAKRGYYDG